ncbi:MAG: hypothetical protein V4504_01565 [Patescibacteria group bacterium]
MIQIKDLLSKLRDSLFSEESKKDEIRRIISEEIKVDIKSSDIEIKNGIINLNIKPIYKNEIFLKKEIIFSKLQESLGKKSPSDFR